MSSPAITINGLAHYYGSRAVLRDLQLQVVGGESLLLGGDNGAGKSTLLRIVSTLMTPSAGELRLFGIDALAERQAARRRVAAHFPSLGTLSLLSVQENLEFFVSAAALSSDAWRSGAELLGLQTVLSQRAAELSHGFRRRLELAVSLLRPAPLLVLDEPFNGLDEATVQRLIAWLQQRVDGGTTLLFTTHQRDCGMALAKRQLWLRGGALHERQN